MDDFYVLVHEASPGNGYQVTLTEIVGGVTTAIVVTGTQTFDLTGALSRAVDVSRATGLQADIRVVQ